MGPTVLTSLKLVLVWVACGSECPSSKCWNTVEINLVEMLGDSMAPSKSSSKGKGLADDSRETCEGKFSETCSFTPITECRSSEKLTRKQSLVMTDIVSNTSNEDRFRPEVKGVRGNYYGLQAFLYPIGCLCRPDSGPYPTDSPLLLLELSCAKDTLYTLMYTFNVQRFYIIS
jgi:hypothetical protein